MNKLIKYVCFVILLLLFRGNTQAQLRPLPYRTNPRIFKPNNRSNAFKNLDAIRNAYINKRLNLTPQEAEVFWPMYKEYQSELSAVLRQRRLNNSNPQSSGMDQLNKDLYYQQQIVGINKHYRDEFLKILPPAKVILLYKSEREFKDELIHQLHEREDN